MKLHQTAREICAAEPYIPPFFEKKKILVDIKKGPLKHQPPAYH